MEDLPSVSSIELPDSDESSHPITASAGELQEAEIPSSLWATQDCVICTEELSANFDFPILSVSNACNHPPRACTRCIQNQIRSNIETRRWDDVRCPECNALMEYHDVQRQADPRTFERFGTSMRKALFSLCKLIRIDA